MKEFKRQASVHWAGDLTGGRGQITTPSKAIDGALYSVTSRFGQSPGTNPEELIAAAHAGCFSMMLAKVLDDLKRSVNQIDTQATVVLQQDNGRVKISSVHLRTDAEVEGIDEATFQQAVEQAKENCPVSMLLKPGLDRITVEAKLV